MKSRRRVLACFEGWWLDLREAVAGFAFDAKKTQRS
jgi:hypothetical protein